MGLPCILDDILIYFKEEAHLLRITLFGTIRVRLKEVLESRLL